MNIRKLIFGEKCPDMDDPKMSKQRKEFNSYGEKFGRLVRLDRLACWLQRQWDANPKRFTAVFLGLLTVMFLWNAFRFVYLVSSQSPTRTSVVEKVEQEMQKRHIIDKSKLNDYGK